MRVYLDSMIWIYFFERNPEFVLDARKLIKLLRGKNHLILTSFLVVGEVLVLPKRNADHFTVASYKLIFSSPGMMSVSYPPPSPDLYAELRARHGTKPVDTLHASLASAAKADLLITEDKKLLSATVPGVGQIVNLRQALTLL